MFTPHFVFSATCAAKKHLISEKSLNKRFFKNTGVVLAGIECSPKISDFRANGISVQERVDFFDTLKAGNYPCSLFVFLKRHIFFFIILKHILKAFVFIFSISQGFMNIEIMLGRIYKTTCNIRAMVRNSFEIC